MKKIIVTLFSLIIMNSAFAYDTAKLRMKIAGADTNKYLLCVTRNTGCVSMLAGNKGKIYSIDVGKVINIFTVNSTTLRMYTQTLPSSCSNLTVNKNQTLTVSGTLVKGDHDKVYLSNMKCSVS